MLDLHSKARQRLLLYFFTNPAARHHLRQLAKQLDVDPSNLSKELRRLEEEGLFASETEGRQKYFHLNRGYPLYREVKRIVERTLGVAPLIAQKLKALDGIAQAFLYGSFARNEHDAHSDIDLLIIGRPPAAALAQGMQGLERQLGREINFTVLTAIEFADRQANKDAYIQDIWQNDRISLIGSA